MKKFNKKRLLVILMMIGLVVLTGCQRNTDSSGATLPEKIIYLTTPWSNMMSEGFISALLVYPLAQLVNWFASLTGSSAASIIIVTLLFTLLTMPLTIKSTVQSQKMQMLQPKLQELQEKYAGKDDEASKMRQAQEMQALYSKYGLNPIGSLITPFIQLPILLSMYYAVQRADAVVNGTMFGLPLSTTPKAALANISQGWPLLVIFVLMIVCQIGSAFVPKWLADRQRKHEKGYKAYTDKGGGAAGTSTNMMLVAMTAMIGVIGFTWPIAMSLYWLVNSVLNVIKTVFVQKRYVVNG